MSVARNQPNNAAIPPIYDQLGDFVENHLLGHLFPINAGFKKSWGEKGSGGTGRDAFLSGAGRSLQVTS